MSGLMFSGGFSKLLSGAGQSQSKRSGVTKVIGFLLPIAGVVLIAVGFYKLKEMGISSCGPSSYRGPCPEASHTWILMVIGGVILLGAGFAIRILGSVARGGKSSGLLSGLKGLVSTPIKDGISGQATVVSATQPSRGAMYSNTKMWLDVRTPDREPYRVKHYALVPADRFPWPGTTVPVTVDRNDPERLQIEWNSIPTHDERMASTQPGDLSSAVGGGGIQAQVIDTRNNPQLREQVIQMLKAQGIDISQAQRSGSTSTSGDDQLDQLEQLVRLRDAGALTEEEFEAQKQKILDRS